MDAISILKKLSSLGISVALVERQEGLKLRLEPSSAVPPELIPEVKEHKQELIALIKLKGYRLKYPEAQSIDKELAEIVARVYHEGYVLLWSTVLQELVAFYRSEADKARIPLGFVPYSLKELKALFARGSKVSESELRLIHEAKKQGARVISHEGKT